MIGTCADLFTMPVLQTFGIQLCPRPALLGELVVTVVFLVLAPLAAAEGAMTLAWLVTAVRLLKLVLYGTIAWIHTPRMVAAAPGKYASS